jgi:hypothetical protein
MGLWLSTDVPILFFTDMNQETLHSKPAGMKVMQKQHQL